MRIGIVTLPFHTNYGGLLQAYALQKTLQDMGHKVEFLERYKESYLLPIKVRYIVYMTRAIRKYLLGSKERVFLERYKHKTDVVVRQYTNIFIKNYLNVRYVKNVEEIVESDYDAYVVGSDQVWRNGYRSERSDLYPFLDFTRTWNVKRIAYACSFGSDEWTYTSKITKRIAYLLKRFDFVSVREDSAVSLCKNYLSIEAKHVLDPTMLLGKEDYISLVENSLCQPNKGTMLCYLLDETKNANEFIFTIAKTRKLTPFRVNSKVENVMARLEDRIQPPVEQWLRGFMDAEFVVTDSFHACVFCIIFNRPFVCLGNRKRGMARFNSLLHMFGQEFRMVDNCDVRIDDLFELPNVCFEKQRELSVDLLREALEI